MKPRRGTQYVNQSERLSAARSLTSSSDRHLACSVDCVPMHLNEMILHTASASVSITRPEVRICTM